MAKGKDPAFLFYSKDWLEGTAEMTSEEKGVYIDLLAHQHQKGSLPAETKKLAKLSGLSESEFIALWSELSSKFIANATGRLVNRKLNGIVSERLDKGWRNKIIGTLGAIIRYSKLSNEMALKIKQTFKVDDFLACTEENINERISEWYSERYRKCLKSIANVNEDANVNGINTERYNTEFSNGKFQFDLKTQLPDTDLESAEMNQFTLHRKKNTDYIKSQWLVFLHERMNEPPEKKIQYQKLHDLTSYFLNWIRNKSPKNGTAYKSGSQSSTAGGQDPTRIITEGVGRL